MKLPKCSPKVLLVIQAAFLYSWLTVLSPLTLTDTYYSVYLLCAIAALFCLYDNYKSARTCSGKEKAVLLVCAGLFSAAVALANYALFEPLSVMQNLFDLFCCLAGGFFCGYAVLLYFLKRLPFSRSDREGRKPWMVFLAVFLSVAAIDLLYLFFAQYPGILTVDSVTTMQELLGLQPYSNVMPFWHTLTVKVFVDLGMAFFGDINAAVACFHVAQIFFMAACFGYVIMTLYQAKVPGWFLFAVYLVYAAQPHNIVYSVTLWKDIPFAGASVLFITAFYRLLKGMGKPRWNYLVFILGAMGFSLWRTNGWYAFLALVLVMWLLMRREYKRELILMTVVLVLCWVLLNPVLSMLDVVETNFVEAFAVPMQQIARVVSEGKALTQEETALLGEIFWLDKLGAAYNPQTVDPVKFETFRYDRVNYIRENLGAYLNLYVSVGLRYPGEYLKAWVEETKGYWNGGYHFWIYTLHMSENTLGIQLTPGTNLIARLYAAVFRYLEKPAILQPLTSIGLHVWTLLGCFVVNLLRKRKEFLLTLPLIILVAGLWLGTPVYAEFRYAYPIFLSMPVILAVTVFDKPRAET